jgi:hypothetical protein
LYRTQGLLKPAEAAEPVSTACQIRTIEDESKVVFPEDSPLRCHDGDVVDEYLLAALEWEVAISPFYSRKSNKH